jgi:hypothetical protein
VFGVAIVVLALGPFVRIALADADPASDILYSQPLFLPEDAAISANRQSQLRALVLEARSEHFPIRLAVIASASDLGSVTALWRKPQEYARFLGTELSLVYRGRLLVVMPNGLGFYRHDVDVGRDAALVGRVPVGPAGNGLAVASLAAVRKLAASAGHPLTLPAATAARGGGSSNDGEWTVFALGVLCVAAAWTVSLRLRPLRLGRRRVAPKRGAQAGRKVKRRRR